MSDKTALYIARAERTEDLSAVLVLRMEAENPHDLFLAREADAIRARINREVEEEKAWRDHAGRRALGWDDDSFSKWDERVRMALRTEEEEEAWASRV